MPIFVLLNDGIKLDNILKNVQKLSNNRYYCDDDPNLGLLEELGYIKVESWDDGIDLSGPDELITTDDGIKLLTINDGNFKTLDLGMWQCMRCETEFTVDKKPYKPYICTNCDRKGPFKQLTPSPDFKPLWKLPGRPVQANPKHIRDEIKAFIKEHLVLPDVRQYDIMCDSIMASWLHEQLPSLGYLMFIGPKESGKTRALEILQELAFHAVRSSTIPPADIYRLIEKYHNTLLIDEAESQLNLKYEMGRTLYAVMNAGYKRGDVAIRCDDTNEPKGYDLFSLKAIASTQSFIPTLESRCFVFEMEQAKAGRHLIDEKWALEIRSMLLYFRYRFYDSLPITIVEMKSGRLTEMFIPIFSVQKLVNGAVDDQIVEYAEEMSTKRKREDRLSLESSIVKAIADLQAEPPDQTTLSSGKRERVYVKDILDRLTEEFGEAWRKKYSTNKLGYRLKDLGLEREKDRYGMYIDTVKLKGRLERLRARFGVEDPEEAGEPPTYDLSQEGKVKKLLEIIRTLEKEHDGVAPTEEVFTKAEMEGVKREEVEEMIKRLKQQGDLFEPVEGGVKIS